MRLQPIVYTTRMADALAWWGTVLATQPAYHDDMWASFPVGDATFALHGTDRLPDGLRVEMSLIADEPLEAIIDRLGAAGIQPQGAIVEQGFGRQVAFLDPDGNQIQINESRW